jgi:hypothetical protein
MVLKAEVVLRVPGNLLEMETLGPCFTVNLPNLFGEVGQCVSKKAGDSAECSTLRTTV